jgi:tetratricopeptide (TPR) repeat protein
MANKAMRAYKRGNAHLSKGEYDLAITCYTEVTKLDPRLASAYHMRGNAYYHKANYGRAIANYDEALRLDPLNQGAFEAREDAIQFPLSIRMGNWLTHKKREEGIARLTEAIERNPNDANAFYQRALIHDDALDHALAIADFSEAIRLAPTNTEFFVGRGSAYDAKYERDRALADYDEAIRLNPALASAYLARGRLYLAKGAYDPREDILVFEANDRAQAISDLTAALRLAQDDATRAEAENALNDISQSQCR